MTMRTVTGMTAASVASCAGLAFTSTAYAQSFTEGFEAATFPPAGWVIHNQSNPLGAAQWRRVTTAPTHSGLACALDDFNAGAGIATLSDWLITHTLAALQNGDFFSFWTKAQGDAFPDRMQLRMSLAGPSTNTGASEFDVGDFTSLLLDINPGYAPGVYPTAAYSQFTVSLNGIASPTPGRFAFRYFVENGGPSGTFSWIIRVDDVAYTEATAVGVCCLPSGACQVITLGACQGQGGAFAGAGVACAAANCPPGGSCCLPDQTCSVLTAAGCAAVFGTWGGVGTVCAATCEGACCQTDGTCVLISGAACANNPGATYLGNGTACAAAGCLPLAHLSLPLEHNWNGMATAGLEQGEANRLDPQGYRSVSDRGLILGEPGSITAGPITGFEGMAYTIQTAPHTHDIVHLGDRRTVDNGNHNWNPPSANPSNGPQPAWLVENDHATIPQVSPTLSVNATLTAQSRIGVIYQVSNNGGRFDCRLTFTDSSAVTVTMHAADWFSPFNPQHPAPTAGSGLLAQQRLGSYWAVETTDLATSTSNNLDVVEAVFSVQELKRHGLGDFTGKRIASITFLNPVGNLGVTPGSGATPATVCGFAIFAASISYPGAAPPACYANCDNSTQPPVLNVADFGCFLTRYAAGEPYANCDNSTQPPVLNVADFGCFLTKYAAGCP